MALAGGVIIPTLQAAIMQATKVGRLAPKAIPMDKMIGVKMAQTAWLLAKLVKMQQMMQTNTINTNGLLPATIGVTTADIQGEIPVVSAVKAPEIAIAAASRKIIFQEIFLANT